MKGKKFGKKTLGFTLALMVCLTSVTGWAAGITAGYTDYTVDGKGAAGPAPGTVTAGISVQGGTAPSKVRLITALYDELNGCLVDVGMSETIDVPAGEPANVESSLNIPTMDGCTVRNFIWDGGLDTMIPVAPVQKNNLALTARYAGAQTVLTWTELSQDEETASYTILQDGSVLAQNIAGDRMVYTIEGEKDVMPFYRILALNQDGVVTGISAEVQAEDTGGMDPTKPQTYAYDMSKMVSEGTGGGSLPNSLTFGSDDRQIRLGGGGTLYYNEEAAAYQYTEELGDGNWGKTEIDGKKCAFTTEFKVGNASKQGCINVLLGDAFAEERIVRLTFEYYDEGTDAFRIRYVNGPVTGNFGVKDIARTGTNTWKTAVVEFADAYFNGTEKTGLYDGTADFRFESLGKMLHIGNMEVEKIPFYSAEFTFDDTNTSSGNYRYNDPQLQMFAENSLTELDEPVKDSKDREVYYQYSGTGDLAYMETEIGGKPAAMTAYYNRPNRADNPFTEGFIYFSLGGGFKSADRNFTVTLEYYDNSAANIGIYYVTGYDAGKKSPTWSSAAVQRTGTNTWKTAVFTLTNAYFNGAEVTGLGDGKCDFRILGSGGAPIYIHSCKVELTDKISEARRYEIKSQNANTTYPDGVSFAVNADSYTGNGIEFEQVTNNGSDGFSVYETQGGAPALSTASWGHGGSTGNNANRNTFLYFRIDDAYLYGMRDSYAEFEIEYFDASDKEMQIHYNKADNAYASQSIGVQTKTNTWKTAKFVLNDACFTGAQNFASDFRLSLAGKTADEQLIIKGMKVKNISHRVMKHSDGLPTVYIAGDSIAANYASGDIAGWGMKIPNHLKNGANVVNYAAPGASTKTFAHFDTISETLFKNDYVLISFGHNDKNGGDRAVDVDTYKRNLKAFIADVLARQAIPVVLSSIPIYDTETGSMEDNIGEYRAAAQAAADELNVPFIDLGGQFKTFLGGLSIPEAEEYFIDESTESKPRTDRVHLSDQGAAKAADIIADGLKESGSIRVLKDYMN